MVCIRETKGLPQDPIPMMTSGSEPRIEMVPPTQTNSINIDECSRGSIPVYSSSSSDFKRVRFQINHDLVIFPTDDSDLTDAPEAISQPLTIYFCPSCCMCSVLCCQVYISSIADTEQIVHNHLATSLKICYKSYLRQEE